MCRSLRRKLPLAQVKLDDDDDFSNKQRGLDGSQSMETVSGMIITRMLSQGTFRVSCLTHDD